MKHIADYVDDEWFEPMPKRAPLEKSVEKGINRYAKECGVLTRKFVSPARRGAPDRIYIVPRPAPGSAIIAFLEIKRPGKKPTPNQFYEMSLLEAAGVVVHWVDTVENGRAFIDGLLTL
jgi:hypothetical protein